MGNQLSSALSALGGGSHEELPERIQLLSAEQLVGLRGLLKATSESDDCIVASPKDGAAYHKLRVVWNLDRMGWPKVIAQPRTPEQVAILVKFAKQHGIGVCVRSFGGHSGHALVDNCLAIDMSQFRQMTVDAQNKTVSVGGGCIIGDVDGACQPHNLALVMGHVFHTGVAGMVLNATSGIGWLARTQGLCAQHLKSVDMVLASGEILNNVTKDSKEHAELFWGMQGAGSNFGIATKMVFGLSKVPAGVLSGDIVKFPIGEGPPIWNSKKTRLELLMNHLKYFETAPDEVSALIVLAGQGPVVARVAYIPKEEDVESHQIQHAKDTMEPMQSFGTSFQNSVKVRNYFSGLQKMAVFRSSYFYQKAANVATVSPEAWEKLCDAAKIAPLGCDTLVQPLGGAVLTGLKSGELPTANAFSKSKYWVIFIAHFPKGKTDPEHREKCMEWARAGVKIVEPFSVQSAGTMKTAKAVNESKKYWDEEQGNTIGGNEDRLVKIKNKYDPDNFFRNNRNIEPSVTK